MRLLPENKYTAPFIKRDSILNTISNKIVNPRKNPYDFNLSAGSGKNHVDVHIGLEHEPEKKLSSTTIPLFIRQTVLKMAKLHNFVDSSTTEETIDVANLIRSTADIRTYINSVESTYVTPNVHNDAFPYDISLVTVMPLRSIHLIDRLAANWNGPVNVCVFAEASQSAIDQIHQLVKKDIFSTKVTLIVVYSPFYDLLFPANMLKNIAISSVFTTHFIMIEPTMIPSANLYNNLRTIKVEILYEPVNLIAIPVFYGQENDSQQSYNHIKMCIKDKKCIPMIPSMMKDWNEASMNSRNIVKLECVHSTNNYYFMYRHNSYDILYDENFVTRGYDDSQLIDHLRGEGYIFNVLANDYFMETDLSLSLINASLREIESIKSQFDIFHTTIGSQLEPRNPNCSSNEENQLLDKKQFEEEKKKVQNVIHNMEQIAMYNVRELEQSVDAIINKRTGKL